MTQQPLRRVGATGETVFNVLTLLNLDEWTEVDGNGNLVIATMWCNTLSCIRD